jgi:copper chaperone
VKPENDAIDPIATEGNPMSQSPQTFDVQGMTCGHCEKAVTTAIRTLDPQAEVRIDRGQNRVEVHSAQSREAIAEAIREEGYTVAG